MKDQIRYVKRQAIDTARWDDCIDKATNGLIYGYSVYLDQLAKNWDGLVWGNYEQVMPLTWNKKYSFYYLYQPAFTASLGIFGNQLTSEIVKNFIRSIPSKFRLVEIDLNQGNYFGTLNEYQIQRTNYILNLQPEYDLIRTGFRQNITRNSQKAAQLGCRYEKNIPVDAIITLSGQLLQKIGTITPEDYERFRNLYLGLSTSGKAETRGVLTSDGKLVASAVFFYSHGRAYYILVGNHPNGKTMGASHFLIDRYIEEKAGQPLLLDFEGSDISNLAFFYSSFGAKKELYPAIRRNSLPWWVKWLKP